MWHKSTRRRYSSDQHPVMNRHRTFPPAHQPNNRSILRVIVISLLIKNNTDACTNTEITKTPSTRKSAIKCNSRSCIYPLAHECRKCGIYFCNEHIRRGIVKDMGIGFKCVCGERTWELAVNQLWLVVHESPFTVDVSDAATGDTRPPHTTAKTGTIPTVSGAVLFKGSNIKMVDLLRWHRSTTTD